MSYRIMEGFALDDLLLRPKHSTITSRAKVDLSVALTKGDFAVKYAHPLIPANMSSIMNYQMAKAIFQNSGMGLIHRFMPAKNQLSILEQLSCTYGSAIFSYLGLSIGVKEADKDNIYQFVNHGLKILCIDIAHGDSDQCQKMTQWINDNFPHLLLIAGNVATGEGARLLWEAGADLVKVNIGAGSICSTRIQTGNGVPQLTALMEVSEARQQLQNINSLRPSTAKRSYGIIADGGCKNSGDLVKSLCFADLVMTGNLFAGCTETPGEEFIIDGAGVKAYVGSSTHKNNHVEGVQAWVAIKGTYTEVLSKLLEGVRSGCSYQNAINLFELRQEPVFVKMTHAGLMESHPHDVRVK
jgi:IMP dehydrogenase